MTFPGFMPINMTYDSSSNVSSLDYLGMSVSTTLTAYNRSSGYIESIIMLMSVNETELDCSIADLDNDSAIVLVYSSGGLILRCYITLFKIYLIYNPLEPLMPSGLNIINVTFLSKNVFVNTEWDLPQGSGPEDVLNSYNITITTIPISDPISNLTQFTEFSLSANYNVEYTITLFAMNCAGESSPTTINFEFGEFSL